MNDIGMLLMVQHHHSGNFQTDTDAREKCKCTSTYSELFQSDITSILCSILRHTPEIVVCGLEAQEDEDIN